MAPPIFGVALYTGINLIEIISHRHAHRFVSMVTLDRGRKIHQEPLSVGKTSGACAWCWPEQEADPPAARGSASGWVMGAELAGRHTLNLLEAMPQSHLPKCR